MTSTRTRADRCQTLDVSRPRQLGHERASWEPGWTVFDELKRIYRLGDSVLFTNGFCAHPSPRKPPAGLHRNLTPTQARLLQEEGLSGFVTPPDPPSWIEQKWSEFLATDEAKSLYAVGVMVKTSVEITAVPATAALVLPELAAAAGIEAGAAGELRGDRSIRASRSGTAMEPHTRGTNGSSCA